MNNILQVFEILMFTEESRVKIGIFLGIAVILGFLLYKSYRDVGRWFLTLVAFLFMLEFLRYDVLNNIGEHMTTRPATLSAVTGIIYTSGLLLGSLIARKYSLRLDQIDQRAKDASKRIAEKDITKLVL